MFLYRYFPTNYIRVAKLQLLYYLQVIFISEKPFKTIKQIQKVLYCTINI